MFDVLRAPSIQRPSSPATSVIDNMLDAILYYRLVFCIDLDAAFSYTIEIFDDLSHAQHLCL